MKKTIFTFKADHVVDLITNSSSELFVLEGKTKEIVEEMIKEKYPNYLSEYEEIKSTKDLSTSELDTYISYSERLFFGNREHQPILGIEPKKLWKDWNKKEELEKAGKYWWPQLTNSGAKLLKAAIDPQNKMYFLFSVDENPNFEFQEKLEEIATRYHLG